MKKDSTWRFRGDTEINITLISPEFQPDMELYNGKALSKNSISSLLCASRERIFSNNEAKGLFTRNEGYPCKQVTLASGHTSTHTFPLFFRRVYKAARVTQVDRLPYLCARVTLAGGLTFSHVNTPSWVNPPTGINFPLVSRPFECNC